MGVQKAALGWDEHSSWLSAKQRRSTAHHSHHCLPLPALACHRVSDCERELSASLRLWALTSLNEPQRSSCQSYQSTTSSSPVNSSFTYSSSAPFVNIRNQRKLAQLARAPGVVSRSMQPQADQRSSLSSRLTSLFSSEAPTPKNHPPTNTPSSSSEPASRRRSLDESFSWDSSSRAARTRPPSPTPHHSRTASMATSSGFRQSHPVKSFSISAPPNGSFGLGRVNQGTSAARNQSHPGLPVLRWLAGKSPTSGEGSSQSRASTPSQSNPPSPSSFSALDDALHDNPFFTRSRPDSQSRPVDMPSRPQAARLPPAFQSSRPPDCLSSLARSALPTACISPLSSVSTYQTSYADPFDDPFASSPEDHSSDLDLLYSPTPIPLAMPHSPPAAHLQRSPPVLTTSPKRSSIEALRSIQGKSKSIHTTASAQFLPSLPDAWKGWFATDNPTDKENMDPFLDDSDKAPNAEAQRERIRQRCKCLDFTS